MTQKDIRWIQRFDNFTRALIQLREAVDLSKQRKLTRLEEQGLIQAFEYTHELAWNTLKDLLEERGIENIYGSKDTTRESFKLGLIENGETWMEMIKDRNLTSHTYNENTATKISSAAINFYFVEFERLEKKLAQIKESQ